MNDVIPVEKVHSGGIDVGWNGWFHRQIEGRITFKCSAAIEPDRAFV
jgi:hypothetical protein